MGELDRSEILLVEDTPSDAEITLRALRKALLTDCVHWVRDGAEALDYTFCAGAYAQRDARHVPRLILLDLHMPRVGGIEVLRHLKANPRTSAIPVVMMTSSDDERDIVESYALGVNGYVVKPVESAVFRDTVLGIGLFWMQLNRVPDRDAGGG
ncbi:MAG: response regulator [Betaproteobacteria bacterium]|nr:response regulator [Betaproteobacteria bacterium]